MLDAGSVVVVDFPGAMGTKRRPAVVLSSAVYHAARPDMIIGLITGQTAAASGPTDCQLADFAAAGLRVASAFRAFLVTLPRAAATASIGRLGPGDWNAVRSCVAAALDVS